MLKTSLEEKKKIIIDHIKENPKTTYVQIRKNTHLHPERIFKEGLKEAFREAGIKEPRNLERKNKEQRRKIIIEYIKKHQLAGGQNIQKDTKINIKSAFENTKKAFEAAEVHYPREKFLRLINKNKEEKIKEVIELIKKEPNTTIEEIREKLSINPYKIFKNINEIYKLAKIEEIPRHKKRALRKKETVLRYINNNPSATQREINKNCHTRIQGLFQEGIFGAYKKAGINFPFERLKLHGSAINEVKQRANNFEEEIAKKLSCYGNVLRLVKTKRGVADIILERKDKKIIIEVKDYLNKEISIHEIKQLNKYLEDFNTEIGFLICHTKPPKDKFLIGKNKIIIIEAHNLGKIIEILDKE